MERLLSGDDDLGQTLGNFGHENQRGGPPLVAFES